MTPLQHKLVAAERFSRRLMSAIGSHEGIPMAELLNMLDPCLPTQLPKEEFLRGFIATINESDIDFSHETLSIYILIHLHKLEEYFSTKH